MSRIALSGNPSGSGTLTIASPNTNSDATFNLPTTGGDLLVNGAAQAANFSALTVNGNNISATNSLGFRNRIINGDMRIDQRNNGAAVTLTSTAPYVVDRWQCNENTDGVATAQRVTDAPAGFINSLRYTTTTADTSLTGSQSTWVQQPIEGFNAADLNWGTANAQPVTISFWVKSSLTGQFAISLLSWPDVYPATYTINSANTWEYKTITVNGPTSRTAGSFPTDNSACFSLFFGMGVGPDLTAASSNTWLLNASRQVAPGCVSVIGTLNATWQVTGVQLEAGSVATPFERRPFGTELALCQRYACSTFPQGVAWGQNQGGTGLYVFAQSTSARVTATFKFPVSMRATPTIVSYNPSRAASGWENISLGGDVAATISGTGEGLSTEQAPVRTTNPPSAVNTALVIHLSASAEL
jgi:hypothetical protein